MEDILQISLAIIITINVITSIYTSRAPADDRIQLMLQLGVIWVIPVFGAAFVSYFLWLDRKDIRFSRQIANHHGGR